MTEELQGMIKGVMRFDRESLSNEQSIQRIMDHIDSLQEAVRIINSGHSGLSENDKALQTEDINAAIETDRQKLADLGEMQNPEILRLTEQIDTLDTKINARDEKGEPVLGTEEALILQAELDTAKKTLFSERSFAENCQALREYIEYHAEDLIPDAGYIAFEAFQTDEGIDEYFPEIEKILEELELNSEEL